MAETLGGWVLRSLPRPKYSGNLGPEGADFWGRAGMGEGNDSSFPACACRAGGGALLLARCSRARRFRRQSPLRHGVFGAAAPGAQLVSFCRRLPDFSARFLERARARARTLSISGSRSTIAW